MIGVSTAMWSSVSGLQVYGTQLGNIGTNIANSGSIGYRATTAYASGGFAGQLSTLAGPASIAQGANISTVYTNHANGVGMSSPSSTHLAITGEGLFGVRNINSEEIVYTRRGDFEFKNDGFLSTPEGYRVQGWPIQANTVTAGTIGATTTSSRLQGTGVPADIQLPGDTSPPQHTTFINIINNLGASKEPGKTTNDSFPYMSLMTAWNGTATPPLGEGRYMYQSTIKVFDEGGSPHEITIYFDKVNTTGMTPTQPGEQWEFIVTMPPSEDKRVVGGDPTATPPLGGSPIAGTSSAGLLMSGNLSFSSSGALENIMAFVPDSTLADSTSLEVNGAGITAGVLNPAADNLANWVAAPMSGNGLPVFFPNFSGSTAPNANGLVAGNTTFINPIELNLGARAGVNGFIGAGNALLLQDVAGVPDPTAAWTNATGMSNIELYPNSTTNYAGSSSTLVLNRDGNAFGILQDIQIDSEGIVTAMYSNGVRLNFAQIALYTFPDLQGLDYLNGSIYRSTNASGIGVPGVGGSGGRGSLQNYQLEQSNVDLSRELTNMIVAQNSYTACTKVIQTSNQALAAVINMV